MHTPFFPGWRPRLAALGRRTAQTVRQATLAQLQEHLRDFLPAPLLSAEDEGANSRDRIYSPAPDVRVLRLATAQPPNLLP